MPSRDCSEAVAVEKARERAIVEDTVPPHLDTVPLRLVMVLLHLAMVPPHLEAAATTPHPLDTVPHRPLPLALEGRVSHLDRLDSVVDKLTMVKALALPP